MRLLYSYNAIAPAIRPYSPCRPLQASVARVAPYSPLRSPIMGLPRLAVLSGGRVLACFIIVYYFFLGSPGLFWSYSQVGSCVAGAFAYISIQLYIIYMHTQDQYSPIYGGFCAHIMPYSPGYTPLQPLLPPVAPYRPPQPVLAPIAPHCGSPFMGLPRVAVASRGRVLAFFFLPSFPRAFFSAYFSIYIFFYMFIYIFFFYVYI